MNKSMAVAIVLLVVVASLVVGFFLGGYAYRGHEIMGITSSAANQTSQALPELPFLSPLSSKSENDLYLEVLIQQSILKSFYAAKLANDQNRPNDAIGLINTAIGIQLKKVNKSVDYELEVALFKELARSFDLIHDESRKEKALAKSNQAEQSRQASLCQKTADQIKQSDKLLN